MAPPNKRHHLGITFLSKTNQHRMNSSHQREARSHVISPARQCLGTPGKHHYPRV